MRALPVMPRELQTVLVAAAHVLTDGARGTGLHRLHQKPDAHIGLNTASGVAAPEPGCQSRPADRSEQDIQSEGRKTHSEGLPQLQCTALPRSPRPAALRKTDVRAASRKPRGRLAIGPSVRL